MRQDSGQLHFSSAPPQRRPRHAFLPRWHFDMARPFSSPNMDRLTQSEASSLETLVPRVMARRNGATARYHGTTLHVWGLQVLDKGRNDAYEAAIKRAVALKRASGCKDLLALDIGSGTGLLSMMAAR